MSSDSGSAHWSNYYTGHLLVLALSLLVMEGLSPEWAKTLKFAVTAWLMAVILVISRGRYVITLWSIQRHPPLARLVRSRTIALSGQKALKDRYLRLRARFVSLIGGGILQGATYHEQMTFAGLLYMQHRVRLWATSLDPWSEFLRTNETYSRLMRSQGDHLPTLNQEHTDISAPAPPPRARVFILPADLFVGDLLADPSAARELVNCHLRLWRCYPRLLLVRPREVAADAKPEGTIWQEMNSSCAVMAPAVPELLIPDFMLVDEAFVYGRTEPEVLEETIPLMRKDLTLAYSAGRSDVAYYSELFTQLWSKAISLDEFGTEILAGDASNPDGSVAMALSVLKDKPGTDVTKLQSLLENTGDDIANFFDDGERAVRYSVFFSGGEPANLGLAFNNRIRTAHGPCYAIDQADLKRSERFCTTWMRDQAYILWSDAFENRQATLRRRIFVVKDWALKREDFLLPLLMQEVHKRHVEVGLILDSALKRFAETTRGVDAADHDAEWIVIDADASSGHPVVGPKTMGVSFGSSTIPTQKQNAVVNVTRNDLLCERLMHKYLRWHETIWNDESSGIKKLTTAEDVVRFNAWLDAASPSPTDATVSHRIEAQQL